MSRGAAGRDASSRRSERGPTEYADRLLGILISGRGSNMAAILDRIGDGRLEARAAIVISNEPEAPGLRLARARGVPVLVLDHRGRSREEHDRRMAAALDEKGVDLVCLAGYMRILSPWFVGRYRGRILNVHPSLLPAFPGREAVKDALAHGVRVTGCTVHLVDAGVDTGPIVLQAAVEVLDGDTVDSLAARILEQEHRLYGEAIHLFFSGAIRVTGRRAVIDRRRPGP